MMLPTKTLNVKSFTLSIALLSTLACFPAQSADFPTAKTAFENKQYQQAYELFSKLVESDYGSLDYSFYLAQSAAAVGKPQEAIVAYERVLINHPDDTRSKLELGRLYYEMQEYTLSQSYFLSALNDEVPETVRTNINHYLDKIDQKSQLATLTGAVLVGAGFDSNVNSAPYASSWYVPVFGSDFTNNTDETSAAYHQEMAVLNHHYNADSKYGFDINNNLLAYSKFYPSESDYDILYVRYKPSLIFENDDRKIETGIVVDNMRYGSDPYLTSYGLSVSLFKLLDPTQAFKAELTALKKDYLRSDDEGRDAVQFALNTKYHQALNQQTTWYAAADFIRNTKDSGDLTDVSYDSLRLEAGMSHQIDAELRVGGNLGLSQTNYHDTSGFFLKKRQDQTLKAAVDISKIIDKDLSVQGRAEHIVNTSNQAAYEYNKSLLLVNLIKQF